jgi:hypothetical protein
MEVVFSYWVPSVWSARVSLSIFNQGWLGQGQRADEPELGDSAGVSSLLDDGESEGRGAHRRWRTVAGRGAAVEIH